MNSDKLQGVQSIISYLKAVCAGDGHSPVLQFCVGTGAKQEIAALNSLAKDGVVVVYVFPGEWVDVAAEQVDVLKTGVFLCPVKCEDPQGMQVLLAVCRALQVEPRVASVPEVDPALRRWLYELIRDDAQYGQGVKALQMLVAMLENRGLLQEKACYSFVEGGGREFSAVICGAGPSLAGQLDALREIEDRVLIIAVGPAVSELMEAGIRPDLVVEQDVYASRNWSEGVDCSELLLFAPPMVDPGVAGRFGHVVWADTGFAAAQVLSRALDVQLPPVWISCDVTTLAMEAARILGCRQVALVGHELDAEEEAALELHIQAGLQLHGAAEVPTFTNCTHRSSLEAWSQSHAKKTVRKERSEWLTMQVAQSDVMDWLDEWDGFHVRVREMLTAVLQLQREKNRYPVRPAAVNSKVSELERADAELKQWMGSFRFSSWATLLQEYVQAVTMQWGGQPTRAYDPQDLAMMVEYFQLLVDLSEDIRAILMRTEVRAVSADERYGFTACSRHAIRMLKGKVPELVKVLRGMPVPEMLSDVHFYWRGMTLPSMEFDAGEGEWRRYASFSKGPAELSVRMKTFAEAIAYEEQTVRPVILFPAPGNWMYVAAWLSLYPESRVIIVEPRLDVFAHLTHYFFLLQFLPESAVVIGADNRCKKWRQDLAKRVAAERKAGADICVFLPEEGGEYASIDDVLEIAGC